MGQYKVMGPFVWNLKFVDDFLKIISENKW